MTTTPTPTRAALSIAPMMDRTDRHYRWFMRQLTRRTLLYTEMITAQALRHGDRQALLGFDREVEHPVALQLGGDEPQLLAECARMAEDFGYDEVNLNVGCPSARVQSGQFGVCLMLRPERVAACVEAMRRATSLPVTVKHRIGVDHHDSYEFMARFVRIVAEAGCQRFTVHARKAWLKGLSPKENREVPPLRYDEVYRLKAEHPHLFIELNGGVTSLAQVRTHLAAGLDAVMIGRAAYDDPWLLATVDRELFGDTEAPAVTRQQVAAAMLDYVDRQVARGIKAHAVTRHMFHLFAGQPGGRHWRRHLGEHGPKPGTTSAVLREALELVEAHAAA